MTAAAYTLGAVIVAGLALWVGWVLRDERNRASKARAEMEER